MANIQTFFSITNTYLERVPSYPLDRSHLLVFFEAFDQIFNVVLFQLAEHQSEKFRFRIVFYCLPPPRMFRVFPEKEVKRF